MKTKLLYLLVIISLLLSACSVASAAPNQPVAPAEQKQAATTDNTQAQGQPADGKLPPKEAFDACTGKAVNDACTFTAAKGSESGTCQTVQDQIACVAPHGSNG